MCRRSEPNHSLNTAVKVNAVHYKAVEDRQTPVERHMKVEREETEQKAHDWREDVKIDHKFDEYCKKLIGMVTELESMLHRQPKTLH